MAEAFGSLTPDVAVLTEYVPGACHDRFIAELASIGLSHVHVSPFTARENHILIASASPLEPRSIRAPDLHPSAPSNALQVRWPHDQFEILGLRLPDYNRESRIRRARCEWLITTAMTARGTPLMILGDFNTDPGYLKAKCGDRIEMLVAKGWQHALPPTGGSYWSPSGHEVRIDHAFVNQHFMILNAEYVREANVYVFVEKVGVAMGLWEGREDTMEGHSPNPPQHSPTPTVQSRPRQMRATVKERSILNSESTYRLPLSHSVQNLHAQYHSAGCSSGGHPMHSVFIRGSIDSAKVGYSAIPPDLHG